MQTVQYCLRGNVTFATFFVCSFSSVSPFLGIVPINPSLASSIFILSLYYQDGKEEVDTSLKSEAEKSKSELPPPSHFPLPPFLFLPPFPIRKSVCFGLKFNRASYAKVSQFFSVLEKKFQSGLIRFFNANPMSKEFCTLGSMKPTPRSVQFLSLVCPSAAPEARGKRQLFFSSSSSSLLFCSWEHRLPLPPPLLPPCIEKACCSNWAKCN